MRDKSGGAPVTFFFGRREVDRFILDAEDSHHAIRVLRQRPGNRIWCIDGSGDAYEVELEREDPRSAEGSIKATHANWNEPDCEIWLVCGLTAPARMEWLVEKATELGAHHILPVTGCYKPGPGRLRRWSRFARSAAKQCQRGCVPDIFEPSNLAAQLERVPANSLKLAADLGGREAKPIEATPGDVVLAIGHDLGFSAAEQKLLATAEFAPISLGERRLRTETAVAKALSCLFFGRSGGLREGSRVTGSLPEIA